MPVKNDNAGNANNANNNFAPNIQPITSGLQANSLFSLAINGDGSKVIFLSELGALTGAEDNNGLADAFLFDASIPKYTRISPAGANGPTTGVDISADGNVIAFATSDNTMGLTDNNLFADIILQINGQKTNITGNANNESGLPRLSSDGNYVVFVSGATNIGGGSVGPNIYLAGPLRQ